MTLLAVLTFFGACSGEPGPEPARRRRQERSSTADREAARFVLETHCGDCHRPDQPEAQRGALAVFDLSRADFASTMSEEQLRESQRRLEDGDAPDADRDAFGQFVDAELARRTEPIRCALAPGARAGHL